MKQILIVEDDHTQNDVLAAFLRHENYHVISAYTIAEARASFSSSVQLVILDLMLTDGNGLDFLKEIRLKSKVPAIVLTALNDEYTQLRTFDLEADEYISKPVSPLVMTKRVNALMARFYPPQAKEVMTIGGFLFDFDAAQIHRADGSEVSLTAIEMKLLQVLYRHRGSVVSRNFIMDYVWGAEYIGEDRLIDAHIKNIRKKLSPDIIVTVKGMGYRMP